MFHKRRQQLEFKALVSKEPELQTYFATEILDTITDKFPDGSQSILTRIYFFKFDLPNQLDLSWSAAIFLEHLPKEVVTLIAAYYCSFQKVANKVKAVSNALYSLSKQKDKIVIPLPVFPVLSNNPTDITLDNLADLDQWATVAHAFLMTCFKYLNYKNLCLSKDKNTTWSQKDQDALVNIVKTKIGDNLGVLKVYSPKELDEMLWDQFFESGEIEGKISDNTAFVKWFNPGLFAQLDQRARIKNRDKYDLAREASTSLKVVVNTIRELDHPHFCIILRCLPTLPLHGEYFSKQHLEKLIEWAEDSYHRLLASPENQIFSMIQFALSSPDILKLWGTQIRLGNSHTMSANVSVPTSIYLLSLQTTLQDYLKVAKNRLNRFFSSLELTSITTEFLEQIARLEKLSLDQRDFTDLQKCFNRLKENAQVESGQTTVNKR